MPELAEVEYFRRQWDAGIGHRVLKVALHPRKRIFRGTDTRALQHGLEGARLLSSAARGKRILFCFSNEIWLGLHLGMTGKMTVGPAEFRPEKHDHLVLFQRERALVFRDSRQFGRVRFDRGATSPSWWNKIVPEIGSSAFTRGFFNRFLDRHAKAPIKAVLLMQGGFSGIGNWMADEILWRAKVPPARPAGELKDSERAQLFRATRFVARESLRTIGRDDSELPRSWLIHQRWRSQGECPRHRTLLRRARIGGRTTVWCSHCQNSAPVRRNRRAISQRTRADALRSAAVHSQ